MSVSALHFSGPLIAPKYRPARLFCLAYVHNKGPLSKFRGRRYRKPRLAYTAVGILLTAPPALNVRKDATLQASDFGEEAGEADEHTPKESPLLSDLARNSTTTLVRCEEGWRALPKCGVWYWSSKEKPVAGWLPQYLRRAHPPTRICREAERAGACLLYTSPSPQD